MFINNKYKRFASYILEERKKEKFSKGKKKFLKNVKRITEN